MVMTSPPAVAPLQIVLADGPIQLDPIAEFLAQHDCGARAWFEGVTRRMTGQRETVLLSYEAYQPMAKRQLERLAAAAAERFELAAVAIHHRLGQVPLGQVSIVIGLCAPHRAGPLAALPWLMDQIKADVTIWKEEHFRDGQRQWIHPT